MACEGLPVKTMKKIKQRSRRSRFVLLGATPTNDSSEDQKTLSTPEPSGETRGGFWAGCADGLGNSNCTSFIWQQRSRESSRRDAPTPSRHPRQGGRFLQSADQTSSLDRRCPSSSRTFCEQAGFPTRGGCSRDSRHDKRHRYHQRHSFVAQQRNRRRGDRAAAMAVLAPKADHLTGGTLTRVFFMPLNSTL
ncbi:unnamed protein product [Ectocarpus sp. 12 AP-2014]